MIEINKDNLVVDIKKVFPNDYNPKRTDPEFQGYIETIEKLKTSLRTKGQVQPIKVRKIGKGYEIIDGYHTYIAMKELEATEIEIKNLGKMSFQDAAALCLTVENIKNPIDPIEEAALLQTLRYEFNISFDELSLMVPYNVEEIEFKIDTLNFDFDALAKGDEEEGDEAGSANADNATAGLQTDGRAVFFGQDQFEVIDRIVAYAHDQQGDEASGSECIIWALLQVLDGTSF